MECHLRMAGEVINIEIIMAKKSGVKAQSPSTQKDHIRQLVEWMSQGVYEKDHIIAMALLCAVAGENMFLIGPPGTAKSMVASRLKGVFKDGRSFDYLMSRFSTPDEIFGPISISRLKNDDRYERLTAGYLPEADVVFLDEIWKAGPSIQNTLLTVINEHIFHNGGQIMHTPMKVLIAASNELPAKDEGLEALWDRFLVRMVSNCIESDDAFFKMIASAGTEQTELSESLYITDELYSHWQRESRVIGIHESVVDAIKALRRSLSDLEKEDGNQLRYYISDRRWRKAFRLMQTSAYLNGRAEINVSDYLLLIHSFWNDVECIPNILKAITSSITDTTVRQLNKIDTSIRQMMIEQSKEPQVRSSAVNFENNNFEEYDYFYYLVENYPDGDTYFSKWDYSSLTNNPRDGIIYYESRRKRNIIHALIPDRPLDPTVAKRGSKLKKVKLRKHPDGVIIDGVPYLFRTKNKQHSDIQVPLEKLPMSRRVPAVRVLFKSCVGDWERMIADNFTDCNNLFLSDVDLALANRMIKDVKDLIKTIEVKLDNVAMMIK